MKNKFTGLLIFFAKVGFLGYVVYILISQQPLIDAKEKEKTQLENLLADQKVIEVQLKQNLQTVDSLLYIEKVAKEKLGMVKPGERVFIDIKK